MIGWVDVAARQLLREVSYLSWLYDRDGGVPMAHTDDTTPLPRLRGAADVSDADPTTWAQRGRVWRMDELSCPVCHGTGEATQADLEAFLGQPQTSGMPQEGP